MYFRTAIVVVQEISVRKVSTYDSGESSNIILFERPLPSGIKQPQHGAIIYLSLILCYMYRPINPFSFM